jgi:predicted nucleic acid-binding protein
MRFVDTNVLLYAISTESREQSKARIALSILDETDLALSVQVLQEFYVHATRRRPAGALTHEQAVSLIEAFLRFPVQEMTVSVMEAALKTSQRYRISYWDAAVIEAARTADCRLVLSEDLSDRQDYGGIQVHNPFGKSARHAAKQSGEM